MTDDWVDADDFWLTEYGLCSRLIYQGSLTEPPEFCNNDAAFGSDYCESHTDDL